MNNKKKMVKRTKQEMHKRYMENGGWIEEIVRLAHEDTRKPHEKVVDTTFEKAPEYYDGFKKCVSKDPQADCKAGLDHLHKREYREAHECFRRAARVGYAEGQYRLGSLYLYGRGVNVDYNLAECWFREAANNGYVPQALDTLAIVARFREKNK